VKAKLNQDLAIVLDVISSILDKECEQPRNTLPIFSFEGLPGAGKTTQIKRVSDYLASDFDKPYYIDLPTDSAFGLLLKSLYGDSVRWEKVCAQAPWLNGLLISIDLRLALAKGAREGAKFALMSRGILSTYYYNQPMFQDAFNDEQSAWQELSNTLKGFEKPSAIIFFELAPDIAHQRVVKRARGTLRKMDQVESMVEARQAFDKLISKIATGIPVHYVNADQHEADVTAEVSELIMGMINDQFQEL